MEMVATIMFYAHTLLCVACGMYAVMRTASAAPGAEGPLMDWRDLDGADEWIVAVAGYVVIGLYLLFTEVYLYRIHMGL